MRSLTYSAAAALALASGFLVSAPVSAQAVGTEDAAMAPEKLGIAREIVDTGFPEGTREAIFFSAIETMTAQMRDGLKSNYPKSDPEAEAIMNDWLAEWVETGKTIVVRHIPALMDAQAKGYAELFTLEELQDIRAFVATESGQRYLQLSPSVMATPAFAEANQAYIQEIGAAFPAAQAELIERLKAYAESKKN